MPATWIFQANPNRFDLDGFFAAKPIEFKWLVTRYASQIAIGDQVFLWRAIGGGDEADAGVIAEAEVIGPVALQTDDLISAAHWSDPSESASAPRILLRLRRVAQKKEIIQRRWLSEDPALRDLTILRMANGTNFEVSPLQAQRVNALWRRTGRDWTYAESVAGLWAYQATYGGPVSRGPDSPVAEIALLIGRAVSGCYNKVMNFRHLDPRDQREGMSGSGATDRQVWAQFFDDASSSIRGPALASEFGRLWRPEPSGTPQLIERTDLDSGEVDRLASLNLSELLARYSALGRATPEKPATHGQLVRSFARDALVVAIARARAEFGCEVPACSHALFEGLDGRRYIEVHHIEPLADGGNDTPNNVVCLCPAHHREAHLGKRAAAIKQLLKQVREPAQHDILRA